MLVANVSVENVNAKKSVINLISIIKKLQMSNIQKIFDQFTKENFLGRIPQKKKNTRLKVISRILVIWTRSQLILIISSHFKFHRKSKWKRVSLNKNNPYFLQLHNISEIISHQMHVKNKNLKCRSEFFHETIELIF